MIGLPSRSIHAANCLAFRLHAATSALTAARSSPVDLAADRCSRAPTPQRHDCRARLPISGSAYASSSSHLSFPDQYSWPQKRPEPLLLMGLPAFVGLSWSFQLEPSNLSSKTEDYAAVQLPR